MKLEKENSTVNLNQFNSKFEPKDMNFKSRDTAGNYPTTSLVTDWLSLNCGLLCLSLVKHINNKLKYHGTFVLMILAHIIKLI